MYADMESHFSKSNVWLRQIHEKPTVSARIQNGWFHSSFPWYYSGVKYIRKKFQNCQAFLHSGIS